eukprot:scaffold13229_cov90-Skeletonema_dohrnii-CCMP3373.AAC.1
MIDQTEEIKNSFNLNADWKEFYGEMKMKEEDPHGMPTPLDEAVKITTHVDANHTNNVATWRSCQQCSHRTVQKKNKTEHSRIGDFWSRNGCYAHCT